jgi:hypothetical protein
VPRERGRVEGRVEGEEAGFFADVAAGEHCVGGGPAVVC